MPARCVIISDGKRGHENQSRTTARMLGDRDPLLMLLRPRAIEWPWRIRLAYFGTDWLKRKQATRIVARLLKPESNEEFRQFAEEVRDARGTLRLFTISTGTSPAALNLVCARMLGAAPVVNMTPSLLPRQLFSLNIVPAHDLPANQATPDNVIVTQLALGYHDQTAAQHLAGQLKKDYAFPADQHYWGVAIGGPSRACPWMGDRVLDELAALHGLSKGEGAKLLVTTSRRTPEHCLNWLKSHYLTSPQVPYFLNATEDPLNPLPAFYELCERIFVTGDSYSMVCEAVHAGHHPVVLMTSPGEVPGKLGRALTRLAQTELVNYRADDAQRTLPERLINVPPLRSEPNSEYQRVQAAVCAHFNLKCE